MDCPDYPRLRPVEAIPTDDNLVCLRDPQGFSDKLLLIPQPLLFVVSLFDGKHSILDIQSEYTRRFGELLFSDKLREIIEQLDGALFLDSERFRQARLEALEAFRAASLRQPSHAGSSYEAEGDALRKQLDRLFTGPEGPGLPAAGAPTGRLRGLIAPHIDLRRGGTCFAWSYDELAREGGPGTFVILGIAHAPMQKPFALTGKDFETPLGTVRADRDFLGDLADRCRSDFYEDEFVHRGEHSVEFQVLFLRYLYHAEERVRIVPILCHFPLQLYVEGSPREHPQIEEFIAALRATLQERGTEACCIASVDLSHIGRRFGQDVMLNASLLERIERDDRAMIETILAGKADDFFQGIQAEGDRRNVCGVPAIYCLLRLLDGTSARLLRYDQAVETASQSVVSFMAAAFTAGR
jgi:AmmeMemoRadiSam system protein B